MRFCVRDAGRLRPSGAAVLPVLAAVLALTGCTGSPSSTPSTDDASAVIKKLGRVAVPTAGTSEPTPTAHAGHPAVLAIGGPVRATLPGGSTALATALGPQQLTTSITAQRTKAVLTLKVSALHGSTTIAADELSSRDETGHALDLVPDGARTATARPGHAAVVKVIGTFDSGAAQVTWQQQGHVIAIWTFNIELD